MRLPRHIGIIPDGNRRWAVREGMDKADGYDHGIAPGMELFRMGRELGVGLPGLGVGVFLVLDRESARVNASHEWE